jgi:hypothetical protein
MLKRQEWTFAFQLLAGRDCSIQPQGGLQPIAQPPHPSRITFTLAHAHDKVNKLSNVVFETAQCFGKVMEEIGVAAIR